MGAKPTSTLTVLLTAGWLLASSGAPALAAGAAAKLLGPERPSCSTQHASFDAIAVSCAQPQSSAWHAGSSSDRDDTRRSSWLRLTPWRYAPAAFFSSYDSTDPILLLTGRLRF